MKELVTHYMQMYEKSDKYIKKVEDKGHDHKEKITLQGAMIKKLQEIVKEIPELKKKLTKMQLT